MSPVSPSMRPAIAIIDAIEASTVCIVSAILHWSKGDPSENQPFFNNIRELSTDAAKNKEVHKLQIFNAVGDILGK